MRLIQKTYHKYFFLLSLLLVLFFSSCDNTFEPFQENHQYNFSMYGTLDLHADTQWVRVMPVEKTLLQERPQSNEVTVTLVQNSTGEEIEMQDSLFQFATDAFAWNYWDINADINARESYTVKAKGLNGKESAATLTMPSNLNIPDVEYSENTEEGIVQGFAEDSLVVLEARYLAQAEVFPGCAPEREIVISHLSQTDIDPDGSYSVEFDNYGTIASRLGVNAGEYRINRRQLVVITVSDGWPEIGDLTDEVVVLPHIGSNVENGTGQIAGIAKRVIEITPRRPPCEPSK